jgi:TRAP-type C4-dicarboxylate transport system permease small subunit
VNKFDELLFKCLCWTCGILIFAMMVVTFSQVLARYAFQHSLSWSEEVGRFIFVWIAFLGMAACFKSAAHVALDLLVKYLTGFHRKTLEIVNGILIMVLSSAIFVSGISLFLLGMRQNSPALNIPMQWVYIVVPVSGLILLYFSIRVLWGYLAPRKKG